MIPVIDIYGPVFQGEGYMTGQLTHFLRLGGCDFRCSWCDTMYAVDPKQVKELATLMEPDAIALQLVKLGEKSDVRTLTISGGNPAIHKEVETVLNYLWSDSWKVAVETQGTIFQEWMIDCDVITVSPKPPSSGMIQPLDQIMKFLGKAYQLTKHTCLKIVVFTNEDFAWAREVALATNSFWDSCYFQTGTHIELAEGHEHGRIGPSALTEQILDDTCALQAKVLKYPELNFVRVQPQLHTLLYGHLRKI